MAISISVERICFLIATVPGIGPVLLQKKQVDQANASNGRLSAADRPRGSFTAYSASHIRCRRDAGDGRPPVLRYIKNMRWLTAGDGVGRAARMDGEEPFLVSISRRRQ
jgi:hypothetical protein